MNNNDIRKSSRGSIGTLRPTAAAIAVAACFSGAALANPSNPTVVHGTATFQQAGNILNITNSANAIINWGSFSISVGELTRFIQPSALSAVLNRVTGQDPSVILGALQSNGRVFLINPNGIVFGAGSQVDVAGLVASTLNLSNDDFLNNRMRFTDGAGAGSVLNQGQITGGSVYLVGNAVSNNGLITSRNGEVVLAAGNSVELVSPGTPNLRVEITAPENEARNLGTISAEAGRIGIYAGLINNSGTLNASSAVVEGGRILLKASKNVHLAAASQLSASGTTGGMVDVQAGDMVLVEGDIAATGSAGKGGTVHVLGDKVGLIGHARIDASGETGGGTVLVGGDYQGANPGIDNAFRTYVGENVAIHADAITEGDGGRVIVWADDITRYYGNISARGGAQGGDGGFAEVSGKRVLDFQGAANLGAAHGTMGTLLLDPENIDIDATTGLLSGLLEILLGTLGAGTLSDGELLFSEAPGATIAIHPSVLNASTANIILQANDTINVNDPVFLANNGVSITLEAGGFLNVFGSITTRGGEINLVAGAGSPPLQGEGALYINAGLDSTGAGANPAGADIRLTTHLSDVGGNSMEINAPVNAGSAGNVILLDTNATIRQNASGVITAHGLAATATNGNVDLSAANNQVDHFAAFAGHAVVDTDRRVQFRNTRNLSLETVDTVSGIKASASANYGGSVNLDLGGNQLIGAAGEVIAVEGDGTSNITIGNASSIGTVGGQSVEVDPGAGTLNLASLSGGIAIDQVSGDLLTSRYTLSAPSGQTVALTASNGALRVNGSLSQSGIDLLLAATGGDDIVFDAGAAATIAADSLTLSPEGGGAVVFTSGATPWTINAPVTVLNDAAVTIGGGQTVNFNDNFDATGAVSVGAGSTLNLVNGAVLASLDTAGTVQGGALEVDALTQTAGSIAVSSLTVNDAFSQSAGSITGTSGDVIINQASGNLTVRSVSAYNKFKAVAASGDLVLTGGSVSAAGGPVELHASGGIGINGGASVSAGSLSPSSIQMTAANGAVTIHDASLSTSYGGPIHISAATGIALASTTQSTSVSSDGEVTLTSGGNVSLTGGSGGSQYARISGDMVTIDASGSVNLTGGAGAGSSAEIFASSEVFINVGGSVNLVTGAGTGATAVVETVASTTVYLDFPNLASGGYFVNGVEGAITDASGSGFYAGGSPGILGSSMIVTYGLTGSGGSGSGSGSTAGIEPPVQTLIVATGQSQEPPDAEKDKDVFKETEDEKKKDAPVCR
ncbi:MAG: filamentous hemagglutinin N-terminal domain-containing protein [Burkholderiales bacterium]|nr:filamentous hemagglutinin N-terminal domain-containing protein [Burkholderiales bacterium]